MLQMFQSTRAKRPWAASRVNALCLSLFLALQATAAHSDELVLKNATFINPADRSAVKRTMLIVNGKIAPPNSVPGAKAKVLDLDGKFVTPALIDLHVHYSGNPLPDGTHEDYDINKTARIMLYCGVCAFFDLAANHYQKVFAARDAQRSGTTTSAYESDIYCVGTAFGRWSITNAESAEKVLVPYIEKWKPDAIKLICGSKTFDTSAMQASVKLCNKLGVKTIVHIGPWSSARTAIEAGASAVTHFFDDEPIPKDLAELWGKSHTASIPTLAVQCDMAKFVDRPQLLNAPLLRAIETPAALKTFSDQKRFAEKPQETLKWQRQDYQNEMQSFRTLRDQHVNLLAGSDTNNIGTFQGYSLHREMALMSEAGYSNWDALAAATTKAADFLNRRTGIATGDSAELLILNADPIKNISNTQNIYGVVHHGNLVPREDLLR